MVRLSFDPSSSNDQRHAEIDAEAARRVLERLAQFLGEAAVAGEPGPATVPADLALWAARAIRSAMAKPANRRAKALTDAFGLTARGRRKSADWLDVGSFIETLRLDGKSFAAAKADAANRFSIDEKTADRYFRQYSLAREEHDAISRDNSP